MGAKDVVIIGLVAVIIGLLTFITMPKWVITPSLTAGKENVPAEAVSNNQQDCEAAGGRWGLLGDQTDREPRCNPRTTDAGRTCTDNSQCESKMCIPPGEAKPGSKATGECYEWRYYYGCTRVMKDGVVSAVGTCID